MVKKKSKASTKQRQAPDEGQAERLVRLRLALGYPTATAFSKFLEIGQQRWANYENGFPLSREIIFRLVQSVPGLTSDWLYFGKPDGLPVDLARRLGELGPPGKRNTA
jgi:hypothetical protein